MPPGSASWPRPACCGRASCRPSRSAPCATSPAIARRRSRSAREANRLHKALEDTGIKLDCVATDILGVSGRAILAHIDFLDEQIERLSEAIGEQIRPFAPAVSLLCSIPGIQHRAAEVIIAEIGTDMTIFPSPKHLASFAGQCPGNDQSAGKRRSGRTRKGSKWLDWTLEEAALAAIRSKDAYLAAQYHRLRPRRGHKKALGAVKHSLICACWQMLTTGELYRDPRRRLLPTPRPRPNNQTPDRPTRSPRTPRHTRAHGSLNVIFLSEAR